MNDQARANAIAVLQREFPASSGEYKICYSCKDSLVAGKVPPMSVSYGYTYPPKPDHLPPLNLVEERLIAPRLPFMSIRRLTHGNGQYGIKGQVVNVPINVPTTVQCLPRNIPDDVAIDVHLKRRLVCKPSYKRGLVKKRNIHEWLKHLEHSPLYKYLKIKIDWRRLANVQDDGAVDDDEIEPAPEVTDLEDPMQAVIALNTMAHTLIFDDGACGVDTVAAITAARTAVHSASDDLGLIEAPLHEPMNQTAGIECGQTRAAPLLVGHMPCEELLQQRLSQGAYVRRQQDGEKKDKSTQQGTTMQERHAHSGWQPSMRGGTSAYPERGWVHPGLMRHPTGIGLSMGDAPRRIQEDPPIQYHREDITAELTPVLDGRTPVYPPPLVRHHMQMSPPTRPPLWLSGLVAETVRQQLGIGVHGPTN
ncbi:hypothetical protein HPB47_007740 [Ixodes persulcatus]|uniref:Uncharacterized protein n=1 Tax=Ixodes persulcatus TaxID=34615 RepID=A0AC60P709_IXOPE|nr:hypothetical protein HPB47_007740 [Ixodes persulcatus]